MEENTFLNFFNKHWSKFLLGILALACIGAWSERYFRKHQQESKQDYIIAQKIFERFQKGEALEQESLETTEAILKRHPEMHPKYDSLLALAFFAQHNSAQAIDYARASLNRVSDQLPECYKEYATTSLLMAQGNFQAALEKTIALDHKITGKEDYLILDGMNKLRLCFLAEKLQATEDTKTYWKALSHHPAFPEIKSIFQEGDLTLADYFGFKSSSV